MPTVKKNKKKLKSNSARPKKAATTSRAKSRPFKKKPSRVRRSLISKTSASSRPNLKKKSLVKDNFLELAKALGPAPLLQRIEPSVTTSPVISKANYDVPKIEEPRPRTSTAIGLGTIPQPANIPIVIAPHRPSPFIIELKVKVVPPASAVVSAALRSAGQRAIMFRYINQLTILSSLSFIYWSLVRLTGVIFRLPRATLPLVTFAELPRLVDEPLVKFRSLRALPIDAIYKSLNKQSRPIVTLPPQQVTTSARKFAPASPRPHVVLWPRLVSFALTAMLLVIPLVGVKEFLAISSAKATALTSLQIGFNQFQQAANLMTRADYPGAIGQFTTAEQSFSEARNLISAWPEVLTSLAELTPLGAQYSSGRHLITAASALSLAGQNFSSILAELNQPATSNGLLSNASSRAELVASHLERATSALSQVDVNDIPSEYRQQYGQSLGLLQPMLGSLTSYLHNLGKVLPSLLGLDEPRRYLVIFQNNNELRPTGGFMGSFGIITIRGGVLSKLEMPGGGTYDLQGSLTKYVQAPEPLSLINPRWEFQDANWWLDWPTSARAIQKFYGWAGGETLDGVIALDNKLIEDLLDLTGPIAMPEYNLTITSDNFVQETTAEVEQRYDRTVNKPKQFLVDLAPKLLERLTGQLSLNPANFTSLVSQALAEKHIQIYSRDQVVQSGLQDLNWAGQVKIWPRYTDSLAIIHTNIGGGKSDGVIKDEVSHEVILNDQGRFTATVSLTRIHNGQPNTWPHGVQNNDYVRFYVPEGSRLLSATGFAGPAAELFEPADSSWLPMSELANTQGPVTTDPTSNSIMYTEFNRTVIANWLTVKPSQSTTVVIKYELPWLLSNLESNKEDWLNYLTAEDQLSKYHFVWEKQAGLTETEFSHFFESELPFKFEQATTGVRSRPNGWSYNSTLRRDTSLLILFTPLGL